MHVPRTRVCHSVTRLLQVTLTPHVSSDLPRPPQPTRVLVTAATSPARGARSQSARDRVTAGTRVSRPSTVTFLSRLGKSVSTDWPIKYLRKRGRFDPKDICVFLNITLLGIFLRQ